MEKAFGHDDCMNPDDTADQKSISSSSHGAWVESYPEDNSHDRSHEGKKLTHDDAFSTSGNN